MAEKSERPVPIVGRDDDGPVLLGQIPAPAVREVGACSLERARVNPEDHRRGGRLARGWASRCSA